MVTCGLLVRLKAKAGKQRDVEVFLSETLPLVREEEGTPAWFALDFSGREYGIFDAFPDEAAREAHLAGPVAKALSSKVGLLFEPPIFQKVSILADKMPDASLSEHGVTRAVLLQFKAREHHQPELEQVLREARQLVEKEPKTYAWFAVDFGEGTYGVFDVFPDNSSRLAHLTGRVPRALVRNASLIGSVPKLRLPKIVIDRVDASVGRSFGGE